MTLPDAYFVPAGVTEVGYEKFTATDHTVSLWAPTMQHGAPPSALLVRALERTAPRDDVRITRVVVELLGPVPVGLLHVRSWVERPGVNIELVVAELWSTTAAGIERSVARGTAWRMKTADTSGLVHVADPPMTPMSEGTPHLWGGMWKSGYLDSAEFVEVAERGSAGPGQVWARPTVALVEGETMTPLERLFSIADIANGVGATLDLNKWTFLNTDLTVHVFRIPTGEWIGVSAQTSTGPDGIGMSAAVLHDEQGAVGRINQTILIRPRP